MEEVADLSSLDHAAQSMKIEGRSLPGLLCVLESVNISMGDGKAQVRL